VPKKTTSIKRSGRDEDVDWLLLNRFPGYVEEVENIVIHQCGDEVAANNPAVVQAVLASIDLEVEDLRDNQNANAHFELDTSSLEWPLAVGRWLLAASDYASELTEMPAAEFFAVREKAHEPEKQRWLERHKRADEGRFFNEPRAQANFEKWLSIDLWTLEEATALSLGKEPRHVNDKTMRIAFSPFVREYKARRDRIRRASKAKALPSPLSPIAFVRWGREQQDFLLPEMLRQWSPAVSWKEQYEALQEQYLKQAEELARANTKIAELEKELRATPPFKSVQTLNKCMSFLLGLALTDYGLSATYQEGVDRTSAFNDMASAITQAGLKVNRKTLQSYLVTTLERFPDVRSSKSARHARGGNSAK
jgi:hypothetical protein